MTYRALFENPRFVIPAKAGIQVFLVTGSRVKPGMTLGKRGNQCFRTAPTYKVIDRLPPRGGAFDPDVAKAVAAGYDLTIHYTFQEGEGWSCFVAVRDRHDNPPNYTKILADPRFVNALEVAGLANFRYTGGAESDEELIKALKEIFPTLY
ncbi:MAG: hypothetical protein HY978_01460 [Candidatus Liptonbacteria bacterium]|nr:hypothetical protein [Candidatus Liptonbacteria bacterium]